MSSPVNLKEYSSWRKIKRRRGTKITSIVVRSGQTAVPVIVEDESPAREELRCSFKYKKLAALVENSSISSGPGRFKISPDENKVDVFSVRYTTVLNRWNEPRKIYVKP